MQAERSKREAFSKGLFILLSDDHLQLGIKQPKLNFRISKANNLWCCGEQKSMACRQNPFSASLLPTLGLTNTSAADPLRQGEE